MARKRKLDSKSTETTEEPPKKQHQQEEPPKEEPQEEEVEEEEEEEEYEEVEEEEEDNEDDPDGETNQNAQISAVENLNDDDDEDEEPIEKLLEPFGKDQLINLLSEAADDHRDVADKIRQVADQDPVHRKIFVHGLGWDTDAEALINAFKPYGEIEDCKAVCDKVTGKSKGYGFILFKKRSGARKALKEPQKKIGNRMAACQLASIGPVPQSSAGPSGPIAAAVQTQQPVSEYTLRKIYVSNVGANLDPQKLMSFFSEFGEIEEGPLGLDKATGKPKGFCLFVYKTVESAKKALEEPHKSFEGHILHCQKAVDGPKHAKSQKPPQQHHNMQSSHYQRNDGGGYVASGGRGGHLMAPAAAGAGIGFNQSAAPALNPALGQALTALLATQGAGLGGLTNLLGTLGSAAAVTQGGVPSAAHGMQGAYGNQASISPGVIGAYANQGAMQGGYPNQQMGQGGSGRGQHGQYTPYMGVHQVHQSFKYWPADSSEVYGAYANEVQSPMMHPVFKFENHLIVHSKYDNVTKTAYNLFGSVLLCRLRVPSPHQLASSNIRKFSFWISVPMEALKGFQARRRHGWEMMFFIDKLRYAEMGIYQSKRTS
ncbi:LOW QUALITY PROTEIN: hypothetical protein NC651_014980 [Populus alba x Populus x berolinensis]|nr:LOW QUALITY PROTEIN: hypothetical protein NC651_014980 [Populus alba x Populus x berolinensis]